MSTDEERDEPSHDSAADPLEERTQRMASDPESASNDDRAEADTTTLGVAIPPPVILDEDDAATIVAPVARPASEPRADRSSVAPVPSLRPLLLERVEPSLGRGERLRLDSTCSKVSVGRAEENDICLYTASASRQHATIESDENGEWWLRPLPGKTVSIDGEETAEALVLEVGMNVVLGQDHLRCVTEALASGEMAANTAADGLADGHAGAFQKLSDRARRIGPAGWAAVGLLGIVLLAWLLLGEGGS